MRRKLRANIAKRLLHKDLFLKKTMEKSIGNFKLPEGPSETHCNGKNKSDSGWFYNGTKCLSVVNARLLVKTLGN